MPKFDIVFASRCLEVMDLKDAVQKLISKANLRVYMTYRVGRSFVDDEILALLDQKIQPKLDFIYLVNIIYQLGFLPKIRYINSTCSKFKNINTKDDFIKAIKFAVNQNLTQNEIRKLENSYESGFKPKTEVVKWALIEVDLITNIDNHT